MKTRLQLCDSTVFNLVHWQIYQKLAFCETMWLARSDPKWAVRNNKNATNKLKCQRAIWKSHEQRGGLHRCHMIFPSDGLVSGKSESNEVKTRKEKNKHWGIERCCSGSLSQTHTRSISYTDIWRLCPRPWVSVALWVPGWAPPPTPPQ